MLSPRSSISSFEYVSHCLSAKCKKLTVIHSSGYASSSSCGSSQSKSPLQAARRAARRFSDRLHRHRTCSSSSSSSSSCQSTTSRPASPEFERFSWTNTSDISSPAHFNVPLERSTRRESASEDESVEDRLSKALDFALCDAADDRDAERRLRALMRIIDSA